MDRLTTLAITRYTNRYRGRAPLPSITCYMEYNESLFIVLIGPDGTFLDIYGVSTNWNLIWKHHELWDSLPKSDFTTVTDLDPWLNPEAIMDLPVDSTTH